MADKIEFTQEQIKEMINLHNQGYLNREIAEIFNTSRQTIGRRLSENNVSSRHPWMTEDKEELICKCYLSGMNLYETGIAVQSNPETVKKILLKHNIEIKDISLINRKYNVDDHYFDSIDTPNKAYILGLIYSDGNINKKTNTLQLSLQEQDCNILNKIKNELNSNHQLYYLPLNKKNPNWSNQYMLSITNKHIKDALIKNGVVPNKSLILEFPDFLDYTLYSHFIRGYFDGDGYISKNPKEKRVSIIGTENFCNTIKKILKENLDIHCSISYCHGNKNVTTRAISIAGGKQVKKFLDWLYKDSKLYIERKYNVYQNLYCVAA